MNILIVTSEFPYPEVPHAGGMTIFKMIETLSARHNIYLISTIKKDEEKYLFKMSQYCKFIETFKVIDANYFKFLHRFHKLYLYMRSLLPLVNEVVNQYKIDIIQVEYHVLAYIISIHMNKFIPYIVDPHDVMIKIFYRKKCLSNGLVRLYWNVLFNLVKRFELSTYRCYRMVLTRSQIEKDMLLQYAPSINISILNPYVRIHKSYVDYLRKPDTILFVGAMDRKVNSDAVFYFYYKIFPIIRANIPSAHFIVVGNNPPERLKKLEMTDQNIKVTGYVSDIVPFYCSASVFVSPLLASGGIIVKILDSMSLGLPVVATSVANDGIEALDGREILIADIPSEFAEKVIQILRDSKLWEMLSAGGKKFVTEKYDWDVAMYDLEEDYKKVVDSHAF